MVNGHQICHGGLIFTLADSAFAFACNSRDRGAVAAGCSINSLRLRGWVIDWWRAQPS
jgi:acyl-CoA thioesterase